MRPLNVIMLGPPGAGKGTQAERFARVRGVPKISTGDILREAVHDGTALGLKARTIMDRGELVNDEIMIGIVRDRLGRPDAARGFVLDGFPRTVAQARALDDIIAGRGPLLVMAIVVPEGELVRRIHSRRICESCGATADAFDSVEGPELAPITSPGVIRADGPAGAASLTAQTAPNTCRRCGGMLVQRADDNEDVVRERVKVYERETRPVIEFYHSRPTFRVINGAQAPDRVAADLERAVDLVASPEVPASKPAPVEPRL
jgi:adenylate kinase